MTVNNNSFQTEIPPSRINITLDIETGGAHHKKELPLKLLVLGDFSHGNADKILALRDRINITKTNLDHVLHTLSPKLTLPLAHFENAITLDFKKFNDFHPDQLVTKIPALNKLVSMRNLLKDLKANLLDNIAFRKKLEKLARNKQAVLDLQARTTAHE